MSIWVKNMATKQEIRKHSLKKRKELLPAVRKEYSRMITGRVLCHPFFQCADMVFCYVAFREEVDTAEILNAAWKTGKKVAVPRVLGEHRMEFCQIASIKDLEPGYQGILEPRKNHFRPVSAVQGMRAVMILPGAAFDRKGNRIGYGKGFYDRYLQQNPDFYKIGLAFSSQCADRIPAENQDICMDVVITEQEEYYADRTAR